MNVSSYPQTVPIIETERLSLRLQTMADWPKYERFMMSDRAIYMDGPYTRAAAWGIFCSDLVQWQLFGHGALMIEERASSACLGQIGINHGPLFPEKEIGWFLYPEVEGKGYAFEAANALKNWAVEREDISTLVSYVSPENQRSINLALRLGATLDENAVGPDKSDLVYRHF